MKDALWSSRVVGPGTVDDEATGAGISSEAEVNGGVGNMSLPDTDEIIEDKVPTDGKRDIAEDRAVGTGTVGLIVV